MRGLTIILTMLGAFFLEWSLNAALAGKTIFMPLSALAFCMWSLRMQFKARMWFALAIGFIMDTVRLAPFGAALLACVVSAFASEAFRAFFSNTESLIVYGVGTVFLFLLFLGMVPFFGFLLDAFV